MQSRKAQQTLWRISGGDLQLPLVAAVLGGDGSFVGDNNLRDGEFPARILSLQLFLHQSLLLYISGRVLHDGCCVFGHKRLDGHRNWNWCNCKSF